MNTFTNDSNVLFLQHAYDVSFAELRAFNQWFVKTFKKEIKSEPRVYGNKAL